MSPLFSTRPDNVLGLNTTCTSKLITQSRGLGLTWLLIPATITLSSRFLLAPPPPARLRTREPTRIPSRRRPLSPSPPPLPSPTPSPTLLPAPIPLPLLPPRPTLSPLPIASRRPLPLRPP